MVEMIILIALLAVAFALLCFCKVLSRPKQRDDGENTVRQDRNRTRR